MQSKMIVKEKLMIHLVYFSLYLFLPLFSIEDGFVYLLSLFIHKCLLIMPSVSLFRLFNPTMFLNIMIMWQSIQHLLYFSGSNSPNIVCPDENTSRLKLSWPKYNQCWLCVPFSSLHIYYELIYLHDKIMMLFIAIRLNFNKTNHTLHKNNKRKT